MFRYLLPAFILIPLLEAWLLIKIGRVVGAGSTILLIVLTAAIGVFWLRKQGISTLANIQNNITAGELPTTELLEGALLLIAGALLLTPGFATDAIGFLLLWPVSRKMGVKWLLKHAVSSTYRYASYTASTAEDEILQTADDTQVHKQHYARNNRPNTAGSQPSKGEIIDAEYTRED